ncbi:hypothetical protein ABG067_004082 [Albugo candida]
MFSHFAFFVSHALLLISLQAHCFKISPVNNEESPSVWYSFGDESAAKIDWRQTTTDRYNESLAFYLARITSASYCSASTILQWNCLPCFLVAPLQSRKVVVDPKNDFQGIVGYSSHHDAIIISYRGSIDIQNWIDDFTFVQKKEYKNLPNVLVHEGFYRLYQEVAKQVVASVQDIRKEHKEAIILVTGHSMGGAVALICAFELSVLRALNVQAVYTFGQPRSDT